MTIETKIAEISQRDNKAVGSTGISGNVLGKVERWGFREEPRLRLQIVEDGNPANPGGTFPVNLGPLRCCRTEHGPAYHERIAE